MTERVAVLSEKLVGSGVLKVIWDGGGLRICHALKGFLMSLSSGRIDPFALYRLSVLGGGVILSLVIT